MKKILIIEKQIVERELLMNLLTGNGIQLFSVEDGHSAFSMLKKQSFDLIFSDLNGIETLVGAASDAASTESIFGKLNNISTDASSGKSSADAALGIVTELRTDIGVEGQSPNLYDRVGELEDIIGDIEEITVSISENTGESEALSLEMLSILTELVNQSAESLGLNLEVKQLTEEETKDIEKVNDKLIEIDAKIQAIKESMSLDEVVIKTYFETE